MPTVVEDLTEGHNLTWIQGDIKIARVFKVTDLVTAPENQLYEAASDPGIPQLGTVYPGTINSRVVEISSEPWNVNGAIVRCMYSFRQGSTWNQPPPATDGLDVKQVTSSTRRVKVYEDRDGNPMILTPPPSLTNQPNYQAVAEIEQHLATLKFERTESAPPVARMRSLVNHTNNALIGSYPANTLLFSRYSAQSDDGGRTWRCSYQFDYDPLEHVFGAVYQDEDGKTPADATGAAWAVYPQASFAGLGLDFDDGQVPI